MLTTYRTAHLALVAVALFAGALGGLASSASAYVGGHDALKDKPFNAGIRAPGATTFFCTGTLVSPDWVLTAAHCLDEGKTAATVQVVVGDTTLDDTTDAAQTLAADRLELHPKWGGDAGDKFDVALIRLAAPSTIQPVVLGTTPAFASGLKACVQRVTSASPDFRFLVQQSCVAGRGKALGWGRTSMGAPTTSRVLREVTPKIFMSGPKQFWRAKAGACPGDSGGPLLVLAADGTPRQIGVASYNDHGGGWFDWLKGNRCSSKSYDYYSDVAGGTLRTWVVATAGL